MPRYYLFSRADSCDRTSQLLPQAEQIIHETYGRSLRISFLYSRVHIFWIDLWTEINESRFQRALSELIGSGMEVQSAENKLREIAALIIAKANADIDTALGAAAELESQGELEKSAEAYAQLIAALPLNDPRRNTAESCLASVNDRRGEAAGEEVADAQPQGTQPS